MSEADWRRSHADPGNLQRVAGSLRERAGRLGDAYAPLQRDADRVAWAGEAANRFRSDIHTQGDRVARARRALEEAAAALDRWASRLEADLEAVRRDDRAHQKG
ncbi:MAG TPA: hypothetical protein VKV73_01185 [Chloroflexota bacterium]|nr:hypothetical protein [Chloroflexota bacterium]